MANTSNPPGDYSDRPEVREAALRRERDSLLAQAKGDEGHEADKALRLADLDRLIGDKAPAKRENTVSK